MADTAKRSREGCHRSPGPLVLTWLAFAAIIALHGNAVAGAANKTRCDMLRESNWLELMASVFNASSVKPPAFGQTLKIGVMMSFGIQATDFAVYNATFALALAEVECSGILGNVALEMVPVSGDCNAQVGTMAFLDLVFSHNISMLLGPECSVAAVSVARIAGYLRIPVFVFSTEASELSDKTLFPTLFRLNPPGTVTGNGWFSLLRSLNLTRVSVVKESGREFDEYVRIFENQVRASTAAKAPDAILLSDSQTISATDFRAATAIDHLVLADARMVVAMVYAKAARALLCEAYRQNLTTCCPGKGHSKMVFIWPSWFTPLSWIATNTTDNYEGMTCTTAQLLEALVGSFNVRSQDVVNGGNLTLYPNSNLSISEYQSRVTATLKAYQSATPSYKQEGDFTFAGFAFDAVWVAVHAIRQYASSNLSSRADVTRVINELSIRVGTGLQSNQTFQENRERFHQGVYKVSFHGVSGPINFTRTSTNRLGATVTVRNIYNASAGCRIQAAQTIDDLHCDFRMAGHFTLPGNYNEYGYGMTNPLSLNESGLVWGTPCQSAGSRGATCPRPIPELFSTETEAGSKCPLLAGLAGRVGCAGAMAIVIVSVTMAVLSLGTVTFLVNRKARKKYKEKYREESMQRLKQFGLKSNEAYDLLVPDAMWEIERKNLDINRKLGEGAFGTVFGAEYFKESGQLATAVAVKTLREGADGEEKTKFFLEIQLMKKFAHEHVVEMLGVCTRDDPMYMVMELMLHGDLRDFLLSHRHLAGAHASPDAIDGKRLTRMALDVAYGLQYLHGINFIHRDVAARNCMVTTNHKVKIGDFGMARDVKVGDYYRVKATALLPIRWMACESLMDGVFTAPSDMWSYGVVLYEMITFGGLPYPGKENGEVMDYIRSGRKMDLPEACPEELSTLLYECWDVIPDQRPTAADVTQLLTAQHTIVQPCIDILTRRSTNPPPMKRRDSFGKKAAITVQYDSEQTGMPRYMNAAGKAGGSSMATNKAYLASGHPSDSEIESKLSPRAQRAGTEVDANGKIQKTSLC